MALLVCESCPVTASMKLIDAKAHGWTSTVIHSECVAWTCPRCHQQKQAKAS